MPRRRSTIYRFAESTLKHTDMAVTGLFRWAATDHTGMGESLNRMPNMGFLDTLHYILTHILISIVAISAGGIMVFVLIAYGIPFLIEILF